jgi:hypothetical protein
MRSLKLYSSPDIIRAMRWAGHVASMGEKRNALKILIVMPHNRDPLGDLGVDRRTVLK